MLMSLGATLRAMEKKFALALVGVILAIIFGLVSLYSLFHVRRPHIALEITNESNVLDVKKPVEDLVVSFQGQ